MHFLTATFLHFITATDNEDEPELLESLGEGKSLDDLYDLSVYEIAGLFEKTIKSKLGIDVVFKAIDLEVAINSD
jgi:hypothetical protein